MFSLSSCFRRRPEIDESGRIMMSAGIPNARTAAYCGFMIDENPIRTRYQAVRRSLDERGRRLHAAAEALPAGHGGVAATSRATRVARSTIGRGIKDLRDPGSLAGKVRRKGAGRPAITTKDPTLLDDLRQLLEPATMGDPAPAAVGFKKPREASDRAARDGPQGECVEYTEAVGAVGLPPPREPHDAGREEH